MSLLPGSLPRLWEHRRSRAFPKLLFRSGLTDRVRVPEFQSTSVVLADEPLAANGVLFLYRVLTYNVHRCVGIDGLLSPQRISAVIASCQPDIVALQELDVRRSRTGGIDQTHWIGRQLGMDVHFHPAIGATNELYGDAILTALPSRLIKAGVLPRLPSRPRLEPRGALWVSIAFDHAEVQLLNTHLGLNRHERLAHIETLLGPEWLGNNLCREPVIVLGDFMPFPVPASTPALRRGSRMPSNCLRVADLEPRSQPHCRSCASITCS